uniref:non-specific serine/threonine protein kinase n=1 Tax=Setaria italica TaxID=4555 RepID=K4AJ20_SETIT
APYLCNHNLPTNLLQIILITVYPYNINDYTLSLLVHLMPSLPSSTCGAPCRHLLEVKKMALLHWKSILPKSPFQMSPWQHNNSPCNWTGIVCRSAVHHGKHKSWMVTNISLPGSDTNGQLGDLNFSALPYLTYINLYNNSLHGSIPANIISLSTLSYLNLTSNCLTGQIPHEIGSLQSLTTLDLSFNNLTGHIPASIGNLTVLTTLLIHYNMVVGPIPKELGSLNVLSKLGQRENQIKGPIPLELGNLTTLNTLLLYKNQITGSIPSELGNLLNLQIMDMSQNQISNSIPASLGNLTKIERLALHENRITNSIPKEIGNLLSGSLPTEFENLTGLVGLALSFNSLSGYLPTNICICGSLKFLHASSNMFDGPIPVSLKTCTTLVQLSLFNNKLTGDISQHFGVYPQLELISLVSNRLSGHISPNWGECRQLEVLHIAKNMIMGQIPPALSKLSNLRELKLYSNHLSGEIPQEIGQLRNLYSLNLSRNEISGSIPSLVSKLSNLVYLDLSGNSLSGSIPNELGDCITLQSLKINNNNLTGNLPAAIGNLASLQIMLDVSNHKLSGGLPLQLEKLDMLEYLLSHNMFSGSIPPSLTSLGSLSTFDVSYNNLEGSIPAGRLLQNASVNWFLHNKGLCGNLSGLQPCYSTQLSGRQKRKLLSLVLPVALVVCSTIIATIVILEEGAITHERDMFSVWNFDGKLAFDDIIRATENFNDKYVIGMGGCGKVYKALLQDGQLVAVKKLHQTEESIVKLYGFCSHPTYNFLVYENDELAKELDWEKRSTLVKDVAQAVSYLHHDCNQPIIHRDITINNILLDSTFKAYVSDFGTARILKSDSSNWSVLAGTYGYIVPVIPNSSFMFRCRAIIHICRDRECDVYSFGVVMLEVVMGDHPKDFLHHIASSREQHRLLNEIIDHRPLAPTSTTKRNSSPHEGGIFMLASFPTSETNNARGISDTYPSSVF